MQLVVMQLHWSIFAGAWALASVLAMAILVSLQLMVNAWSVRTMVHDRHR